MTRLRARTVGVLILALGLSGVVFAQESPSKAPPAAADAPEETAEAEEVKNPRVSILVDIEDQNGRTSLGTIVIELFPEDAPEHVENFLKLVKEGYYSGTTFHRIVPAFIIQGGDPIGKTNWKSSRIGTGGPKYTIPAEIGREHVRGSIAAARKPDAVNPNRESSGSQFYICLADLPSLDKGKYTVFGEVVEGMDVVDKISRIKNSGSPKNQALQKVQMTRVRVTE